MSLNSTGISLWVLKRLKGTWLLCQNFFNTPPPLVGDKSRVLDVFRLGWIRSVSGRITIRGPKDQCTYSFGLTLKHSMSSFIFWSFGPCSTVWEGLLYEWVSVVDPARLSWGTPLIEKFTNCMSLLHKWSRSQLCVWESNLNVPNRCYFEVKSSTFVTFVSSYNLSGSNVTVLVGYIMTCP